MTNHTPSHDPRLQVVENLSHLYRDYLTVIYGLVATKGIEKFAELSRVRPHLDWTSGLFLLAAFLTGLHYWVICVGYDNQTLPLYAFLSGGKQGRAALLLGIDAVAAASFAAIIAVFFYSIPENYAAVFKWFVALVLIGFIYDVYAWILLSFGQRGVSKHQADAHRSLITFWIMYDGL